MGIRRSTRFLSHRTTRGLNILCFLAVFFCHVQSLLMFDYRTLFENCPSSISHFFTGLEYRFNSRIPWRLSPQIPFSRRTRTALATASGCRPCDLRRVGPRPLPRGTPQPIRSIPSLSHPVPTLISTLPATTLTRAVLRVCCTLIPSKYIRLLRQALPRQNQPSLCQKKPANLFPCILPIWPAFSTRHPSCAGRTWLLRSHSPHHRRCPIRPLVCPMLTSTFPCTTRTKLRKNVTPMSLIPLHQGPRRHNLTIPSHPSRRAGIPRMHRRSQ